MKVSTSEANLELGRLRVVQLMGRLRLHPVKLPEDGAEITQLDSEELRCCDLQMGIMVSGLNIL